MYCRADDDSCESVNLPVFPVSSRIRFRMGMQEEVKEFEETQLVLQRSERQPTETLIAKKTFVDFLSPTIVFDHIKMISHQLQIVIKHHVVQSFTVTA